MRIDDGEGGLFERQALRGTGPGSETLDAEVSIGALDPKAIAAHFEREPFLLAVTGHPVSHAAARAAAETRSG